MADQNYFLLPTDAVKAALAGNGSIKQLRELMNSTEVVEIDFDLLFYIRKRQSQLYSGPSQASFGPESVITLPIGRTLRCPAFPQPCEYVRICAEDGVELVYWHVDEWGEDPQTVMGALMGALAAGEREIAAVIGAAKRAVVARGNLNDGFELIGPFPSWDDAAGYSDEHPGELGDWIMSMRYPDTPEEEIEISWEEVCRNHPN